MSRLALSCSLVSDHTPEPAPMRVQHPSESQGEPKRGLRDGLRALAAELGAELFDVDGLRQR